jgi:fibronectin-binding autotransporter adhesin
MPGLRTRLIRPPRLARHVLPCGLTLDATFDTPSVSVGLSSQTITINAVLAGTNGLEKLGAGTLVLAATNTFDASDSFVVSTPVSGSAGRGFYRVAVSVLP